MTSRLVHWKLIAGLALGLAATAGSAWAQTAVITARRDGLKGVQANMEAIKVVVDARGDARPLAPRVAEIVTFFSTFPTRFPEGSGTPPGTGAGETRALPVIWSDRAGFERAAANVLAAAQTFQTAVNTNDPAATATAFQALGGACGACHRTYRAR